MARNRILPAACGSPLAAARGSLLAATCGSLLLAGCGATPRLLPRAETQAQAASLPAKPSLAPSAPASPQQPSPAPASALIHDGEAQEAPAVSGRLVVLYRPTAALLSQAATNTRGDLAAAFAPGSLAVPGVSAADRDAVLRSAGARLSARLPSLGIDAISTVPGEEDAVAARLRAQPAVLAVLHDRLVSGHRIWTANSKNAATSQTVANPATPRALVVLAPGSDTDANEGVGILLHAQPRGISGGAGANTNDIYLNSPQGWAVRQAGGYGAGSTPGPWTTSEGAGVRIAVLDSGVDATHPDIRPNLVLNLSEVDSTALPSACDDGSPADQQGHGTWAASLALGALGPGTGEVAGVAPAAQLLNIKVLERLPATGSTGSPISQTALCEAGQPGGLLSWVLEGIDAALAEHADVISLSLGTLVDLTTGDGAGWKASFDRVTYAALQAGTVIVAAAGNDGLDLSNGRLIELPAQARGVLPVVATTNPACAENLTAGATCTPGPVSRAYYSNYGATSGSTALGAIGAPGGSLPEGSDTTGVTGWVRGACSSGLPNTSDGLPSNGGSFGCFNLGHQPYALAMGTSASAPLVAGAAAVLRAARPNWTAAEIVAALRNSATTVAPMAEPQLNLPAAMALTSAPAVP